MLPVNLVLTNKLQLRVGITTVSLSYRNAAAIRSQKTAGYRQRLIFLPPLHESMCKVYGSSSEKQNILCKLPGITVSR